MDAIRRQFHVPVAADEYRIEKVFIFNTAISIETAQQTAQETHVEDSTTVGSRTLHEVN